MSATALTPAPPSMTTSLTTSDIRSSPSALRRHQKNRLLGHLDKFRRKVYEEGITPNNFPYSSWLRAGVRRQVQLAGAKWLLADLPSIQIASPTTEQQATNLDLVALEESSGLQGDLKRRRDESIDVGRGLKNRLSIRMLFDPIVYNIKKND
nr:uncharacterized protein At4g02000-like [Ipomoea batatas]